MKYLFKISYFIFCLVVIFTVGCGDEAKNISKDEITMTGEIEIVYDEETQKATKINFFTDSGLYLIKLDEKGKELINDVIAEAKITGKIIDENDEKYVVVKHYEITQEFEEADKEAYNDGGKENEKTHEEVDNTEVTKDTENTEDTKEAEEAEEAEDTKDTEDTEEDGSIDNDDSQDESQEETEIEETEENEETDESEETEENSSSEE